MKTFNLMSLSVLFGVWGYGCNQKVASDDDVGDADTGSDTGADTGSDTGADTGADTGSDTGADTGGEESRCTVSADCDDALDCTQDYCEEATGVCEHVPVNFLCANSDTNPCALQLCIPLMGCVPEVDSVNGIMCVSGDACALQALCYDGHCEVSVERDCDDGNICTSDYCNPTLGCVHDNNGNVCNDGSDYTSGDVCASGVCMGAGTVECKTHADCDDGNPCTVLECSKGKCSVNGFPCNDGLLCTLDDCDPVEGCVHTPKDGLCPEGAYCDSMYGCVECELDVECDDESSCTRDECVDGACVHTAEMLVDDEWKSSDNVSCDDADVCTLVSWCDDGKCVSGAGVEFTKDCDDEKTCTLDYCHPEYGCGHEVFGCEDVVVPPPPVEPPPPASEVCNNVDDDGDGKVDEAGAQGCALYYWDADSDGFGKSGGPCLCKAQSQYVAVNGDCDDANTSVHPGAAEICGDGVDQDCQSGVDNGCPPPDDGDPAEDAFCTVRIANSDMYELSGWFTGALCESPSDGSNWCVDVLQLKTYGDGEIWGNAKCRPGQPCNVGATTWGVGDTDWADGCNEDELVILPNVFVISPNCDCWAECMGGDGQFGDPNLHCEVVQ